MRYENHPHAISAAGGKISGGALNPARVLASSLVFNCYWSAAYVYMIAHLLAVLAAAAVAWALWGAGPHYRNRCALSEEFCAV